MGEVVHDLKAIRRILATGEDVFKLTLRSDSAREPPWQVLTKLVVVHSVERFHGA